MGVSLGLCFSVVEVHYHWASGEFCHWDLLKQKKANQTTTSGDLDSH